MRRPSFPTVISLIALFVALGGTSYAVTKLPRNSVGSAQVKPNSLTGADIHNGSVASKDLAASARGLRGPRGPQGPPGSAGGAAGATPDPWHALPYAAGWSDYGQGWSAGAYRKDASGKVHLRGLATQAGDPPPVGLTVFATLPPGYRPTAQTLFAVGAGPPDGYGRVDVHPNGDVVLIVGGAQPASLAPDFVSLDTVSFWTD
jgi:hypothetical protein